MIRSVNQRSTVGGRWERALIPAVGLALIVGGVLLFVGPWLAYVAFHYRSVDWFNANANEMIEAEEVRGLIDTRSSRTGMEYQDGSDYAAYFFGPVERDVRCNNRNRRGSGAVVLQISPKPREGQYPTERLFGSSCGRDRECTSRIRRLSDGSGHY